MFPEGCVEAVWELLRSLRLVRKWNGPTARPSIQDVELETLEVQLINHQHVYHSKNIDKSAPSWPSGRKSIHCVSGSLLTGRFRMQLIKWRFVLLAPILYLPATATDHGSDLLEHWYAGICV